MKKDYFISDIDGTLLVEKTGLVPDETVEYIRTFQINSDYNFSLCSGRSFPMMKHIIDDLDIKLPVICSNGSVILNPVTKEVIYLEKIEYEIQKEVCKIARKYDLQYIVETFNSVIGVENSLILNEWLNKQEIGMYKELKIIAYKSNDELFAEVEKNKIKAIKILLNFDESNETKNVDKIFAELKKLNIEVLNVKERESNIRVFDITAKNINKANAVRKWAKLMNLDYKEIYVFGDNHNDIEMIKQSNRGVAMGNAREVVKSVANFITNNVEDNGVYRFINNLYK